MAELNFGLLNPPGSQSIGNAFVTGMDQAQEARARDLQMQQSQRQGQMADLQFKKAQDNEARLNQFYAHIAANGGPKTADEIEGALLGSGVEHLMALGVTAKMKRMQVEADRALYAAANKGPPGAMVPAPVAAPQADVGTPDFAEMGNRLMPQPGASDATAAANMLMPQPETSVNALPESLRGGPTPASGVMPATAPSATGTRIAEINATIDRMIQLGTPAAKLKIAALEKELVGLNQRHSVGGSLLDNAGNVIATVASPTELAKYQAERAKMLPGDPNIPGYDAKIAEMTTAPGEQRKIVNANADEMLALRRRQVATGEKRLKEEMATGNFTPATIDFLAEMTLNTGVVPNVGRGAAATKLTQRILERTAELAMAPAGGSVSAKDAAATTTGNRQAFAGGMSAQRAAGTIQGNVTSAANEAINMIPLVEQYVAKVNPTNYPLLNKVGNFVDRQGGDPAIVGLAGSLNSLVNVYARAIAPRGGGTVSDKNHAREIINEAMSKGQLSEALKVMRAEMQSAITAPAQAREQLRAGAAPAPTSANKPAPTSSNF